MPEPTSSSSFWTRATSASRSAARVERGGAGLGVGERSEGAVDRLAGVELGLGERAGGGGALGGGAGDAAAGEAAVPERHGELRGRR